MPNRRRVKGILNSIHASAPIEHANLKLRRVMIKYISSQIADCHITQAQAARLFGVTQPRISNLMRGRAELFSLDSLVSMLGRVGMKVVVSFE